MDEFIPNISDTESAMLRADPQTKDTLIKMLMNRLRDTSSLQKRILQLENYVSDIVEELKVAKNIGTELRNENNLLKREKEALYLECKRLSKLNSKLIERSSTNHPKDVQS